MHGKAAFVAAAALSASAVQAQSFSIGTNGTNGYINYTTVTGYFLQDLPATNATAFDYVSHVCNQSWVCRRLTTA